MKTVGDSFMIAVGTAQVGVDLAMDIGPGLMVSLRSFSFHLHFFHFPHCHIQIFSVLWLFYVRLFSAFFLIKKKHKQHTCCTLFVLFDLLDCSLLHSTSCCGPMDSQLRAIPLPGEPTPPKPDPTVPNHHPSQAQQFKTFKPPNMCPGRNPPFCSGD